MSYLRCKECGGSYQLQEGETPEQFESCSCGGELEYFESPRKKPRRRKYQRSSSENYFIKLILVIVVLSVFAGIISVLGLFAIYLMQLIPTFSVLVLIGYLAISALLIIVLIKILIKINRHEKETYPISCQDCGSTYEIPEEESAEGYECSCGGELNYGDLEKEIPLEKEEQWEEVAEKRSLRELLIIGPIGGLVLIFVFLFVSPFLGIIGMGIGAYLIFMEYRGN